MHIGQREHDVTARTLRRSAEQIHLLKIHALEARPVQPAGCVFVVKQVDQSIRGAGRAEVLIETAGQATDQP